MNNFVDAMLNRINKISDVKCSKDIKPLLQATFPGNHCPLMGALMAAHKIKDAVFITVGTDECTYYTRELAEINLFSDMQERCFSIVLDDMDITFGSLKKVRKNLENIVADYNPACIILATTCLIELIGDDYDSFVEEFEKSIKIPVLLVHTEHFSCTDHLTGIERTISAVVKLMEPLPKKKLANIIGMDLYYKQNSILDSLLKNIGYEVGVQILGHNTVENIKLAAAASLNIVTNALGLPLAVMMQKKFKQPYVYFPFQADPDKVLENYKEFFSIVNRDLPEKLLVEYKKSKALEALVKEKLAGVTYIYANSPFACMEVNAYLVKLGMIPLLVQTNYFGNSDLKYTADIANRANPYVCRSANLPPMQSVYKKLKPNFYLGRDFSRILERNGIIVVDSNKWTNTFGFETVRSFLNSLLEAKMRVPDMGGNAV